MRAAQLKDNIVVNYAEVTGYGNLGEWSFVDPKDSVIGSVFNPETSEFTDPPQLEE
jgi:hypothetical protein